LRGKKGMGKTRPRGPRGQFFGEWGVPQSPVGGGGGASGWGDLNKKHFGATGGFGVCLPGRNCKVGGGGKRGVGGGGRPK